MKNFCIILVYLLLVLPVCAGNKTKNYSEVSLYSVGNRYFPRLIAEGQAPFASSKIISLWSRVEVSNIPYIPQSWKDEGYNPDNLYNLNIQTGMTFNFLNGQFIFGVGYSGNMYYFGPLVGFNFEKDKFKFQFLGLYATSTPYKSHYSKEKECVPQIYIRGFDPNSFYKVKLAYSLSNKVDIGILSERHYGTGLFSEYELSKLIVFKFVFGRDFELSKENMFCFGLLFRY